MATISTYVKQTTANTRFFTAPFDCIIGICIESGNTGEYLLYKALNGQSSVQDYSLISKAFPSGTKISNIIMKQGDALVMQSPWNGKMYITGVSA